MSDNIKNNVQNLSTPDDIAQLASTIFGNAAKADLWLNTPIRALRGETPITMLKTVDGAVEVREILRKIERGEFS